MRPEFRQSLPQSRTLSHVPDRKRLYGLSPVKSDPCGRAERVLTDGNEPRRARQLGAKLAPQPCIRLDPRGTRTMKQRMRFGGEASRSPVWQPVSPVRPRHDAQAAEGAPGKGKAVHEQPAPVVAEASGASISRKGGNRNCCPSNAGTCRVLAGADDRDICRHGDRHGTDALILILSIGLQKRLVIAACPECGSGSHPTVNLRPITR